MHSPLWRKVALRDALKDGIKGAGLHSLVNYEVVSIFIIAMINFWYTARHASTIQPLVMCE